MNKRDENGLDALIERARKCTQDYPDDKLMQIILKQLEQHRIALQEESDYIAAESREDQLDQRIRQLEQRVMELEGK